MLLSISIKKIQQRWLHIRRHQMQDVQTSLKRIIGTIIAWGKGRQAWILTKWIHVGSLTSKNLVWLHSLYAWIILESNMWNKKIRSTYWKALINIIRSPLTMKGCNIWESLWNGTKKIEGSIFLCLDKSPRHSNDSAINPLPNYNINPIRMSPSIMKKSYIMPRPLVTPPPPFGGG